MEACRHFKGDRPCKYYWIDRSHICESCPNHNPFTEKILLIKIAALGDVVRSSPLAEGLKKKHPNAQLTWLVKKSGEFFLKGNPYIDRLLIYNEENIRMLECEEFDIMINLDKDKLGGALATKFKAKNKRGFGWHKEGYLTALNQGAEYHYKICLDNYGGKTTNKKNYQEIIFEICELNYEKEKLLLPFKDEKSESFRRKFFSKNGIDDNSLVVIMNTGCGPVYPNKKWTYEGFLEVSRRLLEDPNVRIVLAGEKAEEERNNRLMQDLNHPHVTNTTSQLSIEEFCYLIDNCSILLTGDTLALHVAIAREKKIISFFGPTPHQEIDLFGLGKKFVHEELDCLNCYDQFPCPYDSRCMTLTTTDDVYSTIQELR